MLASPLLHSPLPTLSTHVPSRQLPHCFEREGVGNLGGLLKFKKLKAKNDPPHRDSYGIYIGGVGTNLPDAATQILRILAVDKSDNVLMAALGVLGQALSQPCKLEIRDCTIDMNKPHDPRT